MTLSDRGLEAFTAVAEARSFSKAAQKLRLTQAALSVRIAQLEEAIGTTVILRDRKFLGLTEAGEALLRHAHLIRSIEAETLSQIVAPTSRSGLVVRPHRLRVAGYSSITRSLILPALAEFRKLYPETLIDLRSLEIRDLAPALRAGDVDYIFLNSHPSYRGLEVSELGKETLVRVRSAKHPEFNGVFLNHDSEDPTIENWFSRSDRSKKIAPYRVEYFDEIYSILDAVAAGFGDAVVSRHLVAEDRRFKIIPGPVVSTPILLCRWTQPYVPGWEKDWVRCLENQI